MKKIKITRRQVLYGAGGFTLGLPFLESLVPGPAYGQDVSFVAPKRFCAMTTNHGGVYEEAMYPSETLLSEALDLYSGMKVRRGNLSSTVQNGKRVVSEILSASDSSFTAQLVSKMNVLRGIDIPFYIAHHTGGHLGNYARNDGNGDDGKSIQNKPMPTIDQLMAWSSNFYPDIENVKLRSIVTGSNGRMSYNWSSPSSRSGTIDEVNRNTNARSLFDQVFIPEDEPNEPTEPARPPIVDRVFENYKSLRESNRRMSAADKQRLDDHMDRLAELQRRLNAKPVALAGCQDAPPPGNGGGYLDEMQDLCDVVVAAFMCGTSRVAVIGLDEKDYVADNGDWHQSVAHQWDTAAAQVKLRRANQQAFENVMIYLASRLDAAEEAPGQTVLDSSLLQWSQESGEATHESRSAPVITFGGAGGYLNVGNYCDYRNKEKGMLFQYGKERGYSGLTYNQWLATVLHAMGLEQSEWQDVPNNGPAGYGLDFVSATYSSAYVAGVRERASDPLPFLQT